MIKHEIKYCPRCNTPFECKVGSILLCQCSTISLNDDERDYIKQKFDDCLCVNCLKELKIEYHNNELKNKIKRLLENS